MAQNKPDLRKVAQNKKAYHDYFVEESMEAGIELFGTEVKSIRLGGVNLKDSWCNIDGGELFVNQGRFFGLYGNNHHSIVTFRGVHYLVYHSRPVEQAMGITGNYRSPQMNVLPVSADGRLGPVTGTMKGIAPLEAVSPYQRVSAQTMYRQAGLNVTGYGPAARTVAGSGDWLQVAGVDFARGAKTFTLRASSDNGGAVRVTTGALDGTVLCQFTLPAGHEGEITVDCAPVSGQTDLYILFAGDVTADWWQIAGE